MTDNATTINFTMNKASQTTRRLLPQTTGLEILRQNLQHTRFKYINVKRLQYRNAFSQRSSALIAHYGLSPSKQLFSCLCHHDYPL
ncbi:hypothetical protein OH492_10055 [Vibrio chagasii]|nr:hypothetical protein [Vibrio chagasii]